MAASLQSIKVAALSAAFFIQLIHASTTYGCWSDWSNKFHEDCMKAATALVMGQTGQDNKAWVPSGTIGYTSGNCRATIKGTGNVVPAVNLLASFDQLGSRCQNGWFYYDGGWLNAQLQGHAGWKRGEIELPHNETDGSTLYSWTTDESVNDPAEERNPKILSAHNHPRDFSLSKRTPSGTWINRRTAGSRSFALYRGARMVIEALIPRYFDLPDNLMIRAGDLVDAALTNTGHNTLKTGYAAPDGSTVDALVLAMQTNWVSWQQMFNYFGDGGNVAQDFLWDAIGDYWDAHNMLAGVYHVYDEHGDVLLCSFIINGVTGQVTPLPSG